MVWWGSARYRALGQDVKKRPKPSPKTTDWVSKSDVIQVLRCPYAYWLQWSGAVDRNALISGFARGLIEDGLSFEAAVLSEAEPLETEEDIETILAGDHRLLDVPRFENTDLRISGRPDGIFTEFGLLLPVEIKSHASVTRTDRIELAFYWLLLEPKRTATGSPQGVVILRTPTGEIEERIALADYDFDRVRGLISLVRSVRRNGAEPRVCGCEVCRSEDAVTAKAIKRRDLTAIFNIGRPRAERLEYAGVRRWDDLLTWEPQRIVDELRTSQDFISVRQVDEWRSPVRAYQQNAPVYFGLGTLDIAGAVVMDLEYERTGDVWLYGFRVECRGHVEIIQLWGDTPQERSDNFSRFKDLLSRYPDLPIVTWSGKSADVPNVRAAASSFNDETVYEEVQRRHIDLFDFVYRNIRFPIPDLQLKSVADYFSIARIADVEDGLEALMLYEQYKRSKSQRTRSRIRETLLQYNQDDLDTTLAILRRLQRLCRSAGTTSSDESRVTT